MSRRRVRHLVVSRRCARTGPAVAGHHERGAASIQIVILMPALFLLMFVGVQAALIYHARTVAIAAAAEGARAGAAQGVSSGAAPSVARSAATAFVAAAGGRDVLAGLSVTTSRTAATSTVVVTGTTPSVVPGWTPRISQSASSPREGLTR
ncbi:TadE family protein [Dermatophilaceae bacterium Soc4.6]